MDGKTRLVRAGFAVSVALCLSPMAHGQEAAGPPMGRNIDQMEFGPVPGLPTCVTVSVQTGDPEQGPSILLSKIETGCIAPWHWHTPNEHLLLVSGVVELQMKDTEPFTLRAGGFALMPSRHIHQARCIEECILFVYGDASFDVHYVDARGNEIAPDAALAAVGEMTVSPQH